MEIWKDIEGYEGLYQVSNIGRVKSLNFNHSGKEKLLRQIKNHGYLTVRLYKNSETKFFKVHRLVAAAFIANPENKQQVDHINTISTDNRVENLRWATPKENVNNILTISKLSGSNSHNAREVLQFTKEGVLVRKWGCISDAERELGFYEPSISCCCQGKRKTAHGFVWKYA